ncbi:MAG TPA: PepSY-like domain-containing protein [Cytophagaceae bacterium]|jgi:hypothetical protein|nr:PepSY-like domain-containing protein [Cytophagaceae bacterium]
MKKTALLLVFLSIVAINSNAQQSKKEDKKTEKKKVAKADVPKKVLESYTIIYPGTEVTEWYSYPYFWDIEPEIIERDGVIEYLYPEFYEVDFIKEGKSHKSIFSKSGKHLHTKVAIKDSELPKPVSDAIKNSDYKDWKIVGDKEKLENTETKENVYTIKVEKGKEKHVLHYDENGKLVQVKKIKL